MKRPLNARLAVNSVRRRFLFSSGIALVFLVHGLGAGVGNASEAELEIKVLKEKFEKRRDEMLVPIGRELLAKLQRLEGEYAREEDLEGAAAVEQVIKGASEVLDSGKALRGFPQISLPRTKLSDPRLAKMRDDYRYKVTKVLAPLQKIYVRELTKRVRKIIEERDYQLAINTRKELPHAERQLDLLENPPEVPDGTMEWNGSLYYHHASGTTWHEAKRKCEEMKGHLVTVTSEEENQFVREFGRKRNFWLGATDEQQEGKWVWVTGEPIVFSHWRGGAPDNHRGRQHYAHYWSAGGWDDDYGDTKYGFICEWELPDFH